MNSATSPRWLCITGPTAAGKSAVALALAQRLGAEIISMDSALVYRGMDIGTAKPSADELACVPHHLINIRQPHEAYNAADFACDALACTRQINQRGKLALVVGGTLLYFKALTEGLADMPQANAEIRERIAREAGELGWPALHAQLAVHDAPTAARLSRNDSQRVGRALEVFFATGKPMSQWHAQQQQTAHADLPMLSLEPNERAWLHHRIAKRFEAMLAQGFKAEVQSLMQCPELGAETPAMRAVGYRQARAAFDADLPEPQWTHTVRETGIAATRQLAKRQLTWLRSLPKRSVLACDALSKLQLIEDAFNWAMAQPGVAQ